MKFYRIFIGLGIIVVLFGLAVVVKADDPPKSASDALNSTQITNAVKGDFIPVPIEDGQEILDPATASVTYLELDETSFPLAPTTSATEALPAVKGSLDPGAIMMGQVNGDTDQTVPDISDSATDLIIGRSELGELNSQSVSAAVTAGIVSENFEAGFAAPAPWSRTSPPVWDDVNCFPIESSGSRSAWAAALAGLDPCDATPDNYANNMSSWLIYGPFSLADAQSAWLDFYFRLVSESCTPITDCDYLFWGASLNGTDFSGQRVAGTHISGPFNNGYNFASLDLTNVPNLGNLTGQSQVWIGFLFRSDFSVTAQGPFIDAISLRKNPDPQVYLTQENFDLIQFPNQQWESFDANGATNGDYRWDDVDSQNNSNLCHSHSGSWSMWPADNGADALDVCGGASYPSNANSWLIHGPLNLTDSTEAWVDFYFRNESEVTFDRFWWTVSVGDTEDYWGFWITGNQTQGPADNGFNRIRFDLSTVPGLGDLRGEPEVWLAFLFQSDGTIISGQGPFLDDVNVVVTRPQAAPGAVFTYLPIILNFRSPETTLFIQNNTSGNVSYAVQGAVTCSNLTPGGPHFCGKFTSGTYQVNVTTTECGSNTGEVRFPAGNVTRSVKCVSIN